MKRWIFQYFITSKIFELILWVKSTFFEIFKIFSFHFLSFSTFLLCCWARSRGCHWILHKKKKMTWWLGCVERNELLDILRRKGTKTLLKALFHQTLKLWIAMPSKIIVRTSPLYVYFSRFSCTCFLIFSIIYCICAQ